MWNVGKDWTDVLFARNPSVTVSGCSWGDTAKRIFFNECVEKRIKMKLDYTWSGVLSKIVYGFVFLACCSINVYCSVPILEDIFL